MILACAHPSAKYLNVEYPQIPLSLTYLLALLNFPSHLILCYPLPPAVSLLANLTTKMDHVLFNFPGIRVLLPNKSTSSHEPGLLILLREDVSTRGGTDEFLRLQFFNGSEYPEIDVRLDAHQEATKLDPSTFSIESPQGTLKVVFPPVQTLVPQDDSRIDIPPSERASTTWQTVVDTFEVEIDRWLTYKKEQNDKATGFGSGYPPEKHMHGALVRSMTTPVGSSSNNFAPYDPSNFSDNKGEGRLVLIDEENGSEVGEVGGYQMHTVGVTPGSKGRFFLILSDG